MSDYWYSVDTACRLKSVAFKDVNLYSFVLVVKGSFIYVNLQDTIILFLEKDNEKILDV